MRSFGFVQDLKKNDENWGYGDFLLFASHAPYAVISDDFFSRFGGFGWAWHLWWSCCCCSGLGVNSPWSCAVQRQISESLLHWFRLDSGQPKSVRDLGLRWAFHILHSLHAVKGHDRVKAFGSRTRYFKHQTSMNLLYVFHLSLCVNICEYYVIHGFLSCLPSFSYT